jgi:hypothetical protein
MENILAFMESLVEEAISISELSRKGIEQKNSGGFDRRYARLRQNVLKVLAYTSMDDHLREAKSIASGSSDQSKADNMAGIIESAYDLMKNGLVGKIKFLLHADMFTSMLEQSRALNETGHLVPAAVLGRIIVEGWLRDQAEKAGVKVPEDAKAATINEALKKASIFPIPKWRQVQVLLDIGNAAAHGKTSDLSEAEVAKLLDFIAVNCT